MVIGTQGYEEEAEEFVRLTEAIPFSARHRQVIHLVPEPPGRMLDMGAGSGVDAAGFAARGLEGLAIEPAEALRNAAQALHPSERIEWGNDSLPLLAWTRAAASASTSS